MGLRPKRTEQDESPVSMRRQLSSVARIDPTDRRNVPCWGAPDSADSLQIADDFGEVVPVSPREIEVVETYLGALLDALLRDTE